MDKEKCGKTVDLKWTVPLCVNEALIYTYPESRFKYRLVQLSSDAVFLNPMTSGVVNGYIGEVLYTEKTVCTNL